MSTEPLYWNAMSPRERDAQIHEKVMGQSLVCKGPLNVSPKLGGTSIPAFYLWDCSACDYVDSGDTPPDDHPSTLPVPHYTTSMDAAWQVMQHMAARFNPKDPYGYEPFHRFTHDLFDTDNEELYPSYRYMANEVANWTPEKICLIALRAVGVAIEE